MPDHIEQGPLDPAFAQFREKKLVEKLTERLNAPGPKPRTERPAATDEAPPGALLDRGALEEISKTDRELGKFLEKKLNEAEADAFEQDDARLVFGASLHGGVAESAAPVGAAPSATPKAAVATPPTPAPRPAPAPAASAPKHAPAPKPVPASRPAPAPAPPRATGAPPLTVAALDLPERPGALAGSDDLAARLQEVGHRLSTLLGESSQRLLELKVASAEGIDRAVASLEAEARRVREYLERNEALAGEAAASARSADALADAQDALEERVLAMRRRAVALGDRVAALREALADGEALCATFEASVDERSQLVDRARADVDRLTEREADQAGAIEELERVRSRLAESVERLEETKRADESAIARLKGMKDALTKPVT